MATYETTVEALTGDQQKLIGDKLKEVKEDAEKWAQDKLQEVKNKLEKEGRDELAKVKKEIRDTAKVVRKPELYNKDKDIKSFIKSWEAYKEAMELSEGVAKASFMTYLDEQSKKKLTLIESQLRDMEWESFCNAIVKALSKPQSKIVLKHRLRNLKQQPNESVNDFYNNMLEIAAEAFDEREQKGKDVALRETLCAGLKSESAAIEIMEHEEWTFQEALQHAIKRDTSTSARREMVEGSAGAEVAIFKVEEATNNLPTNQPPRNVRPIRCFNCNKLGHAFKECKDKRRCYHCNRPGHIKKDCFEFIKMMEQRGQAPYNARNQYRVPNKNVKFQNSQSRNFSQEWRSQGENPGPSNSKN